MEHHDDKQPTDQRLIDATRATVRELLRAPDAQALYDMACRLAVEVGGLKLAWLGSFDEAIGRVTPVARAGVDEGYVDAVNAGVEGPRAAGPTGRALLSGEASYVDDIATDERMAPWRERALARGYASSATLPLRVGGRLVAVLNIYSPQRAFFRGGERRLLEELAEDICFTLERLDAQARLARAEQAYRSLFEQAGDSIFIADAHGQYLDVNAAGVKLLGYSREELCRLKLTDVITTEDQARAPLRLELIEPARRAHADRVLRRKDGSVVQVEIAASRLPNGHVLGIARDVTERNQLQARLVTADRLSAVGTLAAGVAHEINNPLAYVLLNLSLIAQHARGETVFEQPELQSLVQETLDGAERVARIVRDLKAVTRHTEGPPVPVSLSAVAEAALRIAAGHVRAKARLTSHLEPDVWVLGDAARLDQVLLNLVLNAAQAIATGTPEENEVHVEVRAEGDHGVVEVRDTGSGIAPEVQRRMFDPFFTTRRQGEGTGLGLAICHGLVASMGGRIDFETELGCGTTFRVYVPRASTVAANVPPAAERRLEGLRVLVLDDEPAIAEALKRLLSRCEVTVFADGHRALERLEAGARFDALLCDVRMPGLPGPEFFALVRERFPQQAERVVFMTGAIADADVHGFLSALANPVLEKPFTAQALARAVRRVVGR